MAIVWNHPQDPRSIPSTRAPLSDAKGRRFRRALASLVILLSGVVFALGVAASSAGPRISLDVHNTPSNGSDGYTDTTASNGATYSYRYSGGEGNGGDVIFKTRGRVTVSVHLANGSGYSIDDVSFTDDTGEQLSWLNPNAGKVATIQNLNTVVQVANYKVTVRDEAADITVPCDPRIVNQ